jgi:hypothetical protein
MLCPTQKQYLTSQSLATGGTVSSPSATCGVLAALCWCFLHAVLLQVFANKLGQVFPDNMSLLLGFAWLQCI